MPISVTGLLFASLVNLLIFQAPLFGQQVETPLSKAIHYYDQRQRYDSCAWFAEQAIILDSANAMAYHVLAMAHSQMEKFHLALQNAERAIQLDSTVCNYYDNRGFVYDNLEQYPLAMRDFDRAIALCPNFARAFYHRGTCFASQEKYTLAMKDYDRSVALDSNNHLVFYNRGIAFRKLGSDQKALANYRRALDLRPDYVPALYNRSRIYEDRKEYQKALEDLLEAHRLDSNDKDVLFNMGAMYIQLKKYGQAIPCFDQLLSKNPAEEGVNLLKALSYAYLKESEKALDWLRKEETPSVNLVNRLAKVLEENRQVNEALEAYSISIEQMPTAEAYFRRGKLYMAKKKLESAKADFDEAYRLDNSYKPPKL